jgi:hypothetical protein
VFAGLLQFCQPADLVADALHYCDAVPASVGSTSAILHFIQALILICLFYMEDLPL